MLLGNQASAHTLCSCRAVPCYALVISPFDAWSLAPDADGTLVATIDKAYGATESCHHGVSGSVIQGIAAHAMRHACMKPPASCNLGSCFAHGTPAPHAALPFPHLSPCMRPGVTGKDAGITVLPLALAAAATTLSSFRPMQPLLTRSCCWGRSCTPTISSLQPRDRSEWRYGATSVRQLQDAKVTLLARVLEDWLLWRSTPCIDTICKRSWAKVAISIATSEGQGGGSRARCSFGPKCSLRVKASVRRMF